MLAQEHARPVAILLPPVVAQDLEDAEKAQVVKVVNLPVMDGCVAITVTEIVGHVIAPHQHARHITRPQTQDALLQQHLAPNIMKMNVAVHVGQGHRHVG